MIQINRLKLKPIKIILTIFVLVMLLQGLLGVTLLSSAQTQDDVPAATETVKLFGIINDLKDKDSITMAAAANKLDVIAARKELLNLDASKGAKIGDGGGINSIGNHGTIAVNNVKLKNGTFELLGQLACDPDFPGQVTLCIKDLNGLEVASFDTLAFPGTGAQPVGRWHWFDAALGVIQINGIDETQLYSVNLTIDSNSWTALNIAELYLLDITPKPVPQVLFNDSYAANANVHILPSLGIGFSNANETMVETNNGYVIQIEKTSEGIAEFRKSYGYAPEIQNGNVFTTEIEFAIPPANNTGATAWNFGIDWNNAVFNKSCAIGTKYWDGILHLVDHTGALFNPDITLEPNKFYTLTFEISKNEIPVHMNCATYSVYLNGTKLIDNKKLTRDNIAGVSNNIADFYIWNNNNQISSLGSTIQISSLKSYVCSYDELKTIHEARPWFERMYDSEARIFEDSTYTHQMPYRLFKPIEYNKNENKQYPLVVFLSGAGQRGTDNQTQIRTNNIAEPLTESDYINKYPCFILSPQHLNWSGNDWEDINMVADLIDDLKNEFGAIDGDRIYVGGISEGGTAAWNILKLRPDLFAAAFPISGKVLDTTEISSQCYSVPVWSFTGSHDVDKTIISNREAIQKINQLGGHSFYTEYPYSGHGIWIDKVYKSKLFYEWLFTQEKDKQIDNSIFDERISEYNNSFYNAMEAVTVAFTNTTLNGEKEIVRTRDTNLGNLVADAIKDYTNADIVVLQSGAIRESIENGPIVGEQILTALPYDNRIMVVEITGSDLLCALENGVSAYPNLDGRFPQISGMTVQFSEQETPGERIKDVKINGESLEKEKLYKLAINDYIYAGGDGYTIFSDCNVLTEYEDNFSTVLLKYFNYKSIGMIDNAMIQEGRIRIIN